MIRGLLLTLGVLLLLPSAAAASTFWTNCAGRLCSVGEDGKGKRVVLGFVDRRPIEHAAVAPDGRLMVATDGVDVFIGSPGGRWREVPRAGGGCCNTGKFHWRGDGRAFMWRRTNGIGSTEMCTANRAGRRLRCRGSMGEGGVDLFGPRGTLIWKPRSEHPLCVRVKPPRACGRHVVRPPAGYDPGDASLSPDGRHIAAYMTPWIGRSRIGIFAVATGKLTRAMWRTVSVQPLHWSPDGRWIAQTVWRNERGTSIRVRLRAARGRATRTITLPGGALIDWTR